jgi:hypothetical protein
MHRHFQVEMFGGAKIDYKFELDRSLDRELAWFFPFQNAIGVGSRPSKYIPLVSSIRQQPARFREKSAKGRPQVSDT